MYQISHQPAKIQTADEAKDKAKSKGKPFCKVCFDAKKPESSYTSHYVKSSPGPDGKIVCPTLLNQACLNCGQPGHTRGYCDQTRIQTPSALQRIQPISAAAELRLLTATIKSQNQNPATSFPATSFPATSFPSLPSKAVQPNATTQIQIPKEKEEPEEPSHVYNPKSNAFGALSHKQKQKQNPKQPQQQSHQLPQPAKPMTMAERIKNPAPKVALNAPTVALNAPTVALNAPKVALNAPTVAAFKPKFADMPPKSQFWWQDLDD
jgi:hypothetical protein